MKIVHIKANVSFMDVQRGDESVSPLDVTVQGWINAGFVTVLEELKEFNVTAKGTGPGEVTLMLEELDDGEDQAGPGSAEPDDEGGVEDKG